MVVNPRNETLHELNPNRVNLWGCYLLLLRIMLRCIIVLGLLLKLDKTTLAIRYVDDV